MHIQVTLVGHLSRTCAISFEKNISNTNIYRIAIISVRQMVKKTCSNCRNEYWINVQIDSEYACTKCGFVEPERIEGQLQGRTAIADE